MNQESASSTSETAGDSSGSFRTWLRSWRYFIWLLIAASLVALFYAEENWRGKRAWKKYKNQLEACGERLDAAAFIAPTVPVSEKFAMTPLLPPLFEFITGTQEWDSAIA